MKYQRRGKGVTGTTPGGGIVNGNSGREVSLLVPSLPTGALEELLMLLLTHLLAALLHYRAQ
jgi:hypothetical protein